MNSTPNKNKLLSEQSKINDYTSFIPTINNLLNSINSTKTMRRNIFDCDSPYDVYTKIENASSVKYECLPFTNKKAQSQLLRLLVTKPRFDSIKAPKQILSNCWFNAMFMCLFISDKGHLFSKVLRKIMITGKNTKSQYVGKELHKALFLLNSSIQQSFDNNKSKLIENTNYIIKDIYSIVMNQIQSTQNISQEHHMYMKNYIRNVDQAGNPLNYFSALCKFIQFDEIYMCLLKYNPVNKTYLNTKYVMSNIKPYPDILVYMFKQNVDVSKNVRSYINVDSSLNIIKSSKNNLVKTLKREKKNKTFKKSRHNNGNSIYQLDSCVLADNENDHFMCFITYKNKEYYFDGYTSSRISEYKWKNRIHSDKNMVFQKTDKYGPPQKFNFQKGLCYLIYYRKQ